MKPESGGTEAKGAMTGKVKNALCQCKPYSAAALRGSLTSDLWLSEKTLAAM
jgi:hypothetical protein